MAEARANVVHSSLNEKARASCLGLPVFSSAPLALTTSSAVSFRGDGLHRIASQGLRKNLSRRALVHGACDVLLIVHAHVCRDAQCFHFESVVGIDRDPNTRANADRPTVNLKWLSQDSRTEILQLAGRFRCPKCLRE